MNIVEMILGPEYTYRDDKPEILRMPKTTKPKHYDP